MSTSPDELRTLLNKWKKLGNRLEIRFSQKGQTKLSTSARVTDVSEKEVTFSFGLEIAGGSLSIGLLNDLVSFRIIDPSNPPESLTEHWDSAFEACVDFAWKYLVDDRCSICAVPKN